MGITIVDVKFTQKPLSVSIRWTNDNYSVYRFVVKKGSFPSDLEEYTVTQNNSVSGIPITTLRLNETTYVAIQGLDIDGNIVEVCEHRVTPNEARAYFKYYPWFERNFLKACLTKAAGMEVALLSRRRDGTVCTTCGDVVTEEAGDPDCQTCYGTGFVGGYYEPITFFALRGAYNQKSGGPNVKKDARKEYMQIVCPPYPQLHSGDYIIDMGTYIRYEIVNDDNGNGRYNTQRLGSVVYQCERLDHHHPLYNYELDTAVTDVTSVTIVDGRIVVSGTNLQPRFGDTYIAAYNNETEEYVHSVISQTEKRLVFDTSIVPTKYRMVVNNRIFHGDLI